VFAGATLLLAGAAALAPVAPAASGLTASVTKPLARQWTAAFRSSACEGVSRASVAPARLAAAAACAAEAACVSKALEREGELLAATARVSRAGRWYRVAAQLVQIPDGRVLFEFSPAAVSNPPALEGAFAAAARELCNAALPSTPPATNLDLAPLAALTAPQGPLPKAFAAPETAAATAEPVPDLAVPDEGDLIEPPAAEPPIALPAPPAPPPPPAAPAPVEAPEPAGSLVDLAPPSAPPPTLHPSSLILHPSPAPPADRRRLAAWLAGGAALVSAGGAALLGAGAVSDARSRDATVEYSSFASAQASAERNGLYANVCWSLAAAAAGASAVLFVLSSAPRTPPGETRNVP